MELVDLIAAAALVTLVASAALVWSVRAGDAGPSAQAAAFVLMLAGLTLTLAAGPDWPLWARVAAPASMLVAIAAVFVGAERASATDTEQWRGFEREFRQYAAAHDHREPTP